MGLADLLVLGSFVVIGLKRKVNIFYFKQISSKFLRLTAPDEWRQ